MLITTHTLPDPDSISSSYALAELLIKWFKISNIEIFIENTNGRLKYLTLPPRTKVVNRIEGEYDYIISVDCGEFKRLPSQIQNITAKRCLNIDHHKSPNDFYDYLITNPEASSTCEMLAEIIFSSKSERDFNDNIIKALMGGIISDTRDFTKGVTETTKFYYNLLMNMLPSVEEHIKDCLNLITYEAESLLVYALNNYSRDDTNSIATLHYPEELVNNLTEVQVIPDFLLRLEDIETVILSYPTSRGQKFSLRTKSPTIDLNKVASTFGGGGHKTRAGFTIDIEEVENTTNKLIEKLKSSNKYMQ